MSNPIPVEREYLCSIPGRDGETAVYAATRSKARYRYWLDVIDCLDVPLTAIKVRAGAPPQPPTDEWQKLGISQRQRDMARQALGLHSNSKTTNRNHFVTGEGSDDYGDWLDLVARGLARRWRKPKHLGGADLFACTKELALAVREHYEHIGLTTSFPDLEAL